MSRFFLRSLLSMMATMLLVSIALFALLEAGSGDVTKKILGAFSTPEQRASYRAQLGLDQLLTRAAKLAQQSFQRSCFSFEICLACFWSFSTASSAPIAVAAEL